MALRCAVVLSLASGLGCPPKIYNPGTRRLFPKFSTPVVTLISKFLALGWHYCLCYKPAFNLVIGERFASMQPRINSHKYAGHRQKPDSDHVTQRPMSRHSKIFRSLWKLGAHFPESVALARFLKSRFLKLGRFQSCKIVFFWISISSELVNGRLK